MERKVHGARQSCPFHVSSESGAKSGFVTFQNVSMEYLFRVALPPISSSHDLRFCKLPRSTIVWRPASVRRGPLLPAVFAVDDDATHLDEPINLLSKHLVGRTVSPTATFTFTKDRPLSIQLSFAP